MVDEINGKKSKVSQVKSKTTAEIKQTSSLQSLREAGGVKAVSKTNIRAAKHTREMSAAEREHLLAMVSEEAKKIFGKSKMSDEQKEIIESAVKQTLDAATVVEEE